MKCPGCGGTFEPYRGALPCHGPCPVGEMIFVPAPETSKELAALFGPLNPDVDFSKAS